MTMTQREIDAAQDALDEETQQKCCPACGQSLPKSKLTHVYAVKMKLGSGFFRWHYSTPVTKAEAEREARELKATGHEALAMDEAAARAHHNQFGDRRLRK